MRFPFQINHFNSTEAYLDLSHTLTDEQLAEFEAVDPFVEQFIASLDKQVAHFESLMVPENYQVWRFSMFFFHKIIFAKTPASNYA